MIPKLPISAKSDAEKQVFAVLKQLPDEFLCILNVSWTSVETERNGEIDFIVAHPEYPLLIIEVKGGHLACKGHMWSRNHTQEMESPVEQAQRNSAGFVKILPRYQGFPTGPWIAIDWLLALPQTSRSNIWVDTGLMTKIFTIEDFQNNGENFLHSLQAIGRSKSTPLGRERYRYLKELYTRTPRFHIPLRIALEQETTAFEELSERQLALLDFCQKNTKALILGGAGSGKTVLAIEKALRCADEGKRTLLTCYNDLLEQKLRESVKGSAVVVLNFHNLCHHLIKEARLPSPRESKGQEFYDTHLPEAALQAVIQNEGYRFDAIIIDEYQDLKQDWLALMELLLTPSPSSILYAFGDEHQSIQKGEFHRHEGYFLGFLSQNFRNTQQIFALIERTYLSPKAIPMSSIGPEGEQVKLIETKLDKPSLRQALSQVLQRLTAEEKVASSEIVILTGKSTRDPKRRSVLAYGEKIGNFTLKEKQEGASTILFDSVRRFKGMESKVVILIELEEATAEEHYVGMSRAMSYLVVLGTRELVESLQEKESQLPIVA